jgi:hypothetical protein
MDFARRFEQSQGVFSRKTRPNKNSTLTLEDESFQRSIVHK